MNFTQGDFLVCSCGAESWVQTFQVCKAKNPVIGAKNPDIYVGVQALGFNCSSCGQDATDHKNRIKREIEAELKLNEKPINPIDVKLN